MGELQQILSRLDVIGKTTAEIQKTVQEIDKWRAVMEERYESHRERTEEVRATVYGNPGDGGLVHDVQNLQNCKSSLKAETARWKDFVLGVLKVVTAAGIVSIVVWLLTMYKTVN